MAKESSEQTLVEKVTFLLQCMEQNGLKRKRKCIMHRFYVEARCNNYIDKGKETWLLIQSMGAIL